MATAVERISAIKSDQLEDIKEYLQFLQTLSEDEKREFHGIIRGMQTMKEIMESNSQKLVV